MYKIEIAKEEEGLWTRFLYGELKAVYKKIDMKSLSEEDKYKIVRACQDMTYAINVARKKGLLGLEEHFEYMEKEPDATNLIFLLTQVVDGTDVSDFIEMSMYRYAMMNYDAVDALGYLLLLRGAIGAIQGLNPRVMEEIYKSMIPEGLWERIEENIDLSPKPDMQVYQRSVKERVEKLRAEDKNRKPQVSKLGEAWSQMEIALEDMSKGDIGSVLKHVEYVDLAVCLKGASEYTQYKFLSAITEKSAMKVIMDMDYMGPVRIVDVESARNCIIEVMLKLRKSGDIYFKNDEQLRDAMERE